MGAGACLLSLGVISWGRLPAWKVRGLVGRLESSFLLTSLMSPQPPNRQEKTMQNTFTVTLPTTTPLDT